MPWPAGPWHPAQVAAFALPAAGSPAACAAEIASKKIAPALNSVRVIACSRSTLIIVGFYCQSIMLADRSVRLFVSTFLPGCRYVRSCHFCGRSFKVVGRLRQMMCDAFVTVDAGQSGLQSCHHTLLRGWGHLMNIEGALIMAIAALARIRRLHGGPDILSELQPMPFEFFRRVDSSQKLVPELVTGLDFSPQFREPCTGDVTVGAARSHAELILGSECCLYIPDKQYRASHDRKHRIAAYWLFPSPS